MQKFVQKVNLQIIQVYPLQKSPLISICLNHEQGGNRLIFGASVEPCDRMFKAHDLNVYANKTFHFLTRADTIQLNGLLPMMYQSFYRATFTNLLICGPVGTCDFIVNTKQLLGMRQLAFAGLDILKEGGFIQKYGVGNRESFIKFLRENIMHSFQSIQLSQLNAWIAKCMQNHIQPLNHVADGVIKTSFSTVKPIVCVKSISYLVEFKAEKKVDYTLMAQMGIGVARIPDIKEGRFTHQGKVLSMKDICKFDDQLTAQAILILDLQSLEEVREFSLEVDTETLIIVHNAPRKLLVHPEYRQLIDKFKMKLVHIVTSHEFYQTLNQDAWDDLRREINSYYHLDYLKAMRNDLPQYFTGRDQVKQFYGMGDKRIQSYNIQQLWPDQRVLLAMKQKTMQLWQGNVYYESLKVARSMQFGMKTLIRDRFNKRSFIRGKFEFQILGSASSIDTQSRGTSCYMLSLPELSIILDMGSNSVFQLYYASENDADLKRKLCAIQIIYVSHFHCDHHLGILEFVRNRLDVTHSLLHLIIPHNLFHWYDRLLQTLVNDLIGDVDYRQFIQITLHHELQTDLIPDSASEMKIMTEKALLNTEIESIQVDKIQKERYYDLQKLLEQNGVSINLLPTQHCQSSAGIRITYDGYSIVYSGDRQGAFDRRAKNFLDGAKSCDLMVHECTFGDDSSERAMEVQHSTFFQAVLTGMRSEAKYLLLTHFTTKNLINIKSFILEYGELDYRVLRKQLLAFNKWNCDIEEVLNYLENNVIFANDFCRFSDANLADLPKISRTILRSLIP